VINGFVSPTFLLKKKKTSLTKRNFCAVVNEEIVIIINSAFSVIKLALIIKLSTGNFREGNYIGNK
jgi:hypothetical protein